MNPSKSLYWKSVVAVALLVAAVPLSAQRRRSVRHPGPSGPATTVVVTGTVFDAVTGAPVVFADIHLGSRTTRSDSRGKFKITTSIHGTAVVTAGRSGYLESSQNVSADSDLTFRLQPTPTIRLRLTNGTEHDIDLESAEFGYLPTFGSYVKNSFEDFCRPGGIKVTLDRSQIAKIAGPAISESHSPCCPANPVLRITATLETGEITPLYFNDSCDGYTVDFIGRDHVTGNFVFAKFTDVAEIVFP